MVELGANHPGEIDYLSRIARPDVAVLNNAGRAHLEGFGSLEGVARAKLEIINGLAEDGVFVYQRGRQICRNVAPVPRATIVSCTFGVQQAADV